MKNIIEKLIIPKDAETVIRTIQASGYQAYLVGGCVRDMVLGKEPHDWDICTSALPEEIRSVLIPVTDKVVDTGLKHGTLTAVINKTGYEVTTFRTDGEYTDGRHPDSVRFVSDLKEDLARRDFTINAMAFDLERGLIDPFNGKTDVEGRQIRCVGDPDKRFREDGLRILRALRFASTYELTIEEKTSDSIHRNVGLLKNISKERIQSELTRLIVGKNAFDILSGYKDVITYIIPDLGKCIGFDQNNPYHLYDVYDHIIHSVKEYEGTDISVKMALLLHDIGKPESYTEDEKGGHFHGHAILSKEKAERILRDLRFDNKTSREILTLVENHDLAIEPTEHSVRRALNRFGEDIFFKLMDVRLADIAAHSPKNREERTEKYLRVRDIAREQIDKSCCFTMKDLSVSGKDLIEIGIEPGVGMGDILRKLLREVMDGERKNNKSVLLQRAKELAFTVEYRSKER